MTRATTLLAELSKLNAQYHSLLADIEAKRQEIADELSPVKVGDKVKVITQTKTIEGVVTRVGAFYKNMLDQALNTVDARPTWCVSGKRINATTGVVGKWGFEANPVFYDFDAATKTFTVKDDALLVLMSAD